MPCPVRARLHTDITLAKEWRVNGAGTRTHKYDRIYWLKPGRGA
jgi:hypothetical protein